MCFWCFKIVKKVLAAIVSPCLQINISHCLGASSTMQILLWIGLSNHLPKLWSFLDTLVSSAISEMTTPEDTSERILTGDKFWSTVMSPTDDNHSVFQFWYKDYQLVVICFHAVISCNTLQWGKNIISATLSDIILSLNNLTSLMIPDNSYLWEEYWFLNWEL